MSLNHRTLWCTALVLTLASTVFFAGCDDDSNTGSGGGTSVSCGEGTIERDSVCVAVEVAQNTQPLVESVTLSRLSLSEEQTEVLHTLNVSVSLSIQGEAFQTDAVLGLQTPDGLQGCLVGALPLSHSDADAAAGVSPEVSLTAEFVVPEDCSDIANRADLQPFLAFDIWGSTQWQGRPAEAPTDDPANPQSSPFEVAKGSMLSFTGCTDADGQACGARPLALDRKTLKDAQLLEVSLDSSVLILPIPDREIPAIPAGELTSDNEPPPEEGAPPPPEAQEPVFAAVPTAPHLDVTTRFRVLGLGAEEVLENQGLLLTYEIRPSALDSTQGSEQNLEWVPLLREQLDPSMPRPPKPPKRGEDAPHLAFLHEDPITSITGPEPKDHAAPMFVQGMLAQRLSPLGEWGKFDEFELRVCLRAPFEGPPAGPDSPENPIQQNNCATMPIFVLRRAFDKDGDASPAQPPADTGQYSATYNRQRTTENLDYSDSDGGVSIVAWLEMVAARNSSTATTSTSHTTYYGHSASLAATQGVAWFEGGSTVTGTVFSQSFTIAHAHATFMDFSASSDKIYLLMQLFGSDVIPAISYTWSDGTLTLTDVLDIIADAKDKPSGYYKSDYTFDYDLVGKSVSTNCGSVTASIKAYLTLGLDSDETSITKSSVAPVGDPCANYASTTVNGICFYKGYSGTYKTWSQYEAVCAASGGYPAPIRSAADITAARTALGNTNTFWVGIEGYNTKLVFSDPFGNTFNIGTFSDWNNTADDELGLNTSNDNAYTAWASGEPAQLTESSVSTRHARISSAGTMTAHKSTVTSAAGVCAYEADNDTIGGTQFTLAIVPHADAGVEGEISWSWSGATSFGLTLTLSLLDFSIPFTTTAKVQYKTDGGFLLTLSQSIEATLTTLAGELEFWIKWKTCFIWCTSGEHKKTVAEWDGIVLGTWYILSPTSVTFSFP